VTERATDRILDGGEQFAGLGYIVISSVSTRRIVIMTSKQIEGVYKDFTSILRLHKESHRFCPEYVRRGFVRGTK
jgi:hypothetical protein